MELREYLYEQTRDTLDELKRQITKTKKVLGRMKYLDVNHAEYSVHLHSLLEGEKDTTTRYIGSLELAIRSAEEIFKEENHLPDVQAKYQVDIIVGKESYSVPENYWKKYKAD